VATETEGVFTVRFASRSQLVTYAATPAAAGGWEVRELPTAPSERPMRQRLTPLPVVALRAEHGSPASSITPAVVASLEGNRVRTPDGGHWIIGDDRITLRDPNGRWVLERRHRPDGKWLDWIETAAIGSDGVLAVVDRGRTENSCSVSLYSPRGEPLAIFDLPSGSDFFPSIAITTEEVIVTAGSTGFVADRNGNNLRRFALPRGRDRGSVASEVHVSRDGRRLMLTDGTGLSYRYHLPFPAR
jgi:hypothetical protein